MGNKQFKFENIDFQSLLNFFSFTIDFEMNILKNAWEDDDNYKKLILDQMENYVTNFGTFTRFY